MLMLSLVGSSESLALTYEGRMQASCAHQIARGIGQQLQLFGSEGAAAKPLLVLGVQIGEVIQGDAALLTAAAGAHPAHACLGACRQVDEAVRHQALQLGHHRVEPARRRTPSFSLICFSFFFFQRFWTSNLKVECAL